MEFTMAKDYASAYPVPGPLCTQLQVLVSVCSNTVPQPVSSTCPSYYMQTSGTNVSSCGSLSCCTVSCIPVSKEHTAKDIYSGAEICNAM